jgi:hypothetical protein
LVAGLVERPTGRVLRTVAAGNVVDGDDRHRVLAGCCRHRLAHLLLHLLRGALGEPDGLRRRHHPGDERGIFYVAAAEQLLDLGEGA